MRLIIVGSLQDQLGTASKIALSNGAKVTHAPDEETAMQIIRSKGADLLMVDVVLNIKSLIEQLDQERISTPVVACGVGSDSDKAVAAIQAGAKEYIPLPPDPELIAAVLTAISTDDHDFIRAGFCSRLACGSDGVCEGRARRDTQIDRFGAAGDDYVRSAIEWLANGIISLASHDNRLTHRQTAEILEILGKVPRHSAATSDNTVFSGRDD